LHRNPVWAEIGIAGAAMHFLGVGIDKVIDQGLFGQGEWPAQSLAADFDSFRKAGIDTIDEFYGSTGAHSHVDNYNTSAHTNQVHVQYKFMASPQAVESGTNASIWTGIDHVQLAIPVGGEGAARAFYVGVLGFTEVPKPAVMIARGGAWFESGAVKIHVGSEEAFVPARKAHPALTVRGLISFISRAGLEARWNDEIEGVTRCHIDDPFGNRIELIEAQS